MKNKVKIIKNMGFSWTFFRAKYELKRKTGLLKRHFKPVTLSNSDLIKKHIKFSQLNSEEKLLIYLRENRDSFFIKDSVIDLLPKLLSKSEHKKAIARAEQIVMGDYIYFSKQTYSFNEPINWHYSPFTQMESPKNKHWLDISDLNSKFGDIKFIWELSRFSLVYDLVRAYTLTNDERYVKKYWDLVENWIDNNPSEYGVNYKCGQEMSLRIMAWLFGLYAFIDHEETTAERVTRLLITIYLHINHVDKHFDFALKSVKNNHTISEAAGMYTVGILFPLFDKSKKWRKKGKYHLENEAMWQIYDDGSYIQNSMNYHRLMLQVYTWVIRLGEINDDYFSKKLKTRLQKSIMFLYQHQIESTGRVPNYGMNDGALIHPLSTNNYLDYRPQLNAAWMAVTGDRLYKPGSYDESLLWLFGQKAFTKDNLDVPRKSMRFDSGGYYTFRNETDFGMIRCTTYKHRPAQADMLHFDLWLNGINVLSDAGTYSYNTDPQLMAFFNGTSSHNTIMIENRDQMDKGNRFIWLNWTKSRLIKYKTNDRYTLFEGEHYGYNPLVHKRGILHYDNMWIIVDDIVGKFNKKTEIKQSWLFGIDSLMEVQPNEWLFNVEDEEYKLITKVQTIKAKPLTFESQLYNGRDNPVKGWQSLYYGDKVTRPQLVIEKKTDSAIRFITIVSKEEVKPIIEKKAIYMNNTKFVLRGIGQENIFKDIEGN